MRSDIILWIALSRIKGIGPLRFRYLIEHFNEPKIIFNKSLSELSAVWGMDKKTAENICQQAESAIHQAQEDFQFIQNNQINVLTYLDADYPQLLLNIHSFPPLLYIKGNLTDADNKSIAIVGSRKATTYGVLTAKKLAAEIATTGLTVISGLARGIDTAAHQGALEVQGRTIAILGNGIDICYPRENRDLMKRIIHSGAVISEFPISSPPIAQNFPIRNRIISGLSLGVVIVEAQEKSGALITAEYALQQNREVYAVPGNIHSSVSRGTNQLIKQGAKLIESVEDIISELSPGFIQPLKKKNIDRTEYSGINSSINNLTESEQKILDILTQEPMHIDIISQNTKMPITELPQYLLNLELAGHISQLSGKRFVKTV